MKLTQTVSIYILLISILMKFMYLYIYHVENFLSYSSHIIYLLHKILVGLDPPFYDVFELHIGFCGDSRESDGKQIYRMVGQIPPKYNVEKDNNMWRKKPRKFSMRWVPLYIIWRLVHRNNINFNIFKIF